jgi:penicillin-binding protein 2
MAVSGVNKQFAVIRVLIIMVVCLALRAGYLQLIDKSLSRRAEATAIEKLTAYPSRGLIFDRRGKLMVNNFATYDLMVSLRQLDPQMDTLKLCTILGITKDDFKEYLNKDFKSGKFSPFVPFVFQKKIPIELYARLQESLYEFPGFFVQLRNIRGYSYPNGAQLLGYINEASPEDIERNPLEYQMGDYLGAAGIEAKYESYLKGEKGINLLLKDNRGRTVGKYQEGQLDTAAVSGKDLITSIDIELQAYGESLLANKSGSVVAIEPATGEILCMISAPTYDPNELTMTQNRAKVFSRLLTDPSKPLFDRTVMAKYPPGSIFKTVVALVGLQENTLNSEAGKGCGGGYYYAGRLYKCHGHGGIGNVRDAVAYSCNTYFFQEFRNIVDKFGFSNSDQGLNLFEKYMREFGLGQKLGVDFPGETAGNIPSTAYYDKIYPKKLGGWRSPTIMSVGIGQGEVQLTTLQMANLAACIANKGYWYPPHIAKEFRDKTPIPSNLRKKNQVSINREYFNMVVDGMAGCVDHGTARIARIEGIEVCGKTGTSQNPHGEDHSVFFAFAPKDNPKIAIAVFVENAGWGASYAAPIASLMIEKYITGSIPEARLPLEKRMKETNLLEKFFASQVQESVAASQPAVRPDTLPSPERIPSDIPEGRLPGPIEVQIPVNKNGRDSTLNKK